MGADQAFRALSDVVLAMAGEREVEPVLQRLVHAARDTTKSPLQDPAGWRPPPQQIATGAPVHPG